MPFFGKLQSQGPSPVSDATPPALVPRKRHVRELYHPAQMAAVLRRERARCDRQNGQFSIVLFRFNTGVSDRALYRVAATLLKLIRETDELGRYDERTLSAVLPDTDTTGAAMLVSRLHRTTPAAQPCTSTIYTYPEPSAEGRPFVLETPRGLSQDERDQPPGNGHGGGRISSADRAVTPSGGNGPAVDPHRPVNIETRSMADLFAEPLPWWKRALDMAIAGSAIVVASPLMIGAALAVRLSSPGPVIFTQLRTGLGGRPFRIYKFRTMVVDAERKQAALKAMSEQDGPAFKLKNDPRIFTAGKWLRKLSIDELPQLFNVLKGDMTLVGPRPLPVHEADACRGWQQRRHDVTPGLTCIWQVEGRSRVKFDEWMRMDMRYARRRSLSSDVSLVLRTIPAVLLRRGAN